MSDGPVITATIYRIATRAPTIVTEGTSEATGAVLPPLLYATAPEKKGGGKKFENLGPITLEKEDPTKNRQLVRHSVTTSDSSPILIYHLQWQVKEVDKERHIYTINRADGTWFPNEIPPSFGYDTPLELRRAISCMGFKKPKPTKEDPNPVTPQFKWMILSAPSTTDNTGSTEPLFAYVH